MVLRGLPSDPTMSGDFKVPDPSAPVWRHAQKSGRQKSLKTMFMGALRMSLGL